MSKSRVNGGRVRSDKPRTVAHVVRHPNAEPFFNIPRCQAQTKSGEQCKHEARHGEDFCALHQEAKPHGR